MVNTPLGGWPKKGETMIQAKALRIFALLALLFLGLLDTIRVHFPEHLFHALFFVSRPALFL